MEGDLAASPRIGGCAAAFGGVVLLATSVWWSFVADSYGAEGGFLPGLFTALSLLGTLLATASVLWLYAVLREDDSPEGSLWASLGVAVTALSLAGLGVFGAMSLVGAESGRLFLTVSVLAWWVRPLGLILFAFALVRADILFGRALLLFLAAFLEIPVLANIAQGGSQPLALLFGIPALQSGLPAAVAWISFGYSLIILDGRDHSDEGDGGSTFVTS